MPIRIDALRAAANRQRRVVARSLTEAKNLGASTAFICHSHHDSYLVQGLSQVLTESGWRVYVDWLDTEMPSSPNRETAQKIKNKIVEFDFFLFLATHNSMASRWCPWEIGYADGKKDLSRILVVPTTDGTTTHGSEYLQLYRRVDLSDTGELAVWSPGMTTGGTYVRSL